MSRRTHELALAILAVAVAPPLAACGPGRTAAATQPTPVAFDPAGSDPRAVKIADEVLAAAGGEAAWATAKELTWSQAIVVDGAPVLLHEHAWDRWNGRHGYVQRVPGKGGFKVMYNLFSSGGRGWAVTPKGGEQDATMKDQREMIAKARERWNEDAYLLALPFKLKDPGVHLRWMQERGPEGAPGAAPTPEAAPAAGGEAAAPAAEGEAAAPAAPAPAAATIDVIRATFDPGVGKDIYFISIDKATHLPVAVEVLRGGEDGPRVGYKVADWIEAGGLKFATTWTDLGNAQAIMKYTDITVRAKPDEENYVPPVE